MNKKAFVKGYITKIAQGFQGGGILDFMDSPSENLTNLVTDASAYANMGAPRRLVETIKHPFYSQTVKDYYERMIANARVKRLLAGKMMEQMKEDLDRAQQQESDGADELSAVSSVAQPSTPK
jgi:hypothetical protein